MESKKNHNLIIYKHTENDSQTSPALYPKISKIYNHITDYRYIFMSID